MRRDSASPTFVHRLAGPRPGVLVVAAVVLLGSLGGFAYELIHSQGESRRGAERSFTAEARITSDLTGSLFSVTVAGAASEAVKTFGGTVTDATVTTYARRSKLAYAFIVDSRGRVLASSEGTPVQARAHAGDLVSTLARNPSAKSWLSGLTAFKGKHVIEWALPFQTPHGKRVEIESLDASALSGFFSHYLSDSSGSRQRIGYVVDGDGSVIADSSGRSPVGARLGNALSGRLDGGRYQGGSGERYSAVARLAGSDWRVILTEPTTVLYPALAGSSSWILYAALAAFAVVALVALLLLRRILIASDRIAAANEGLNELNVTLEERVAERTAVAEQRAHELARSNSELEQFASVASHDLQEPLRKIRMYCGRLPRRLGSSISEEAGVDLARIQGAAERMQQLIDDLLSFARVSSRQRDFQAVDLNTVVAEVVSDLEGSIEAAGASINVGQLPVVAADHLQMRQLLQNLLSNAIKFQREGTRPEIRITADVVDARWRISVQDNGIGFDTKYAERIFSAFERLHGRAEFDGTGIGLSIARKIAWRHGGDLTATSTIGAGSTFTLTLPLPDEDAAPVEVAA